MESPEEGANLAVRTMCGRGSIKSFTKLFVVVDGECAADFPSDVYKVWPLIRVNKEARS